MSASKEYLEIWNSLILQLLLYAPASLCINWDILYICSFKKHGMPRLNESIILGRRGGGRTKAINWSWWQIWHTWPKPIFKYNLYCSYRRHISTELNFLFQTYTYSAYNLNKTSYTHSKQTLFWQVKHGEADTLPFTLLVCEICAFADFCISIKRKCIPNRIVFNNWLLIRRKHQETVLWIHFTIWGRESRAPFPLCRKCLPQVAQKCIIKTLILEARVFWPHQ